MLSNSKFNLFSGTKVGRIINKRKKESKTTQNAKV
jgi:hypothetical protein